MSFKWGFLAPRYIHQGTLVMCSRGSYRGDRKWMHAAPAGFRNPLYSSSCLYKFYRVNNHRFHYVDNEVPPIMPTTIFSFTSLVPDLIAKLCT